MIKDKDKRVKLIKNNMEHYKVFYMVAACKSLTGAAKLLSITQPAVSQAIKQLEDNLHVRLFNRISKGVSLTPEGELLYHYVSCGYEQFALGEEKMNRLLNMEVGELKIGASDMTLQFFLLPYLERYHEAYPDIKIGVTNGPTPETLMNLHDGKIDFGIISSPFDAGDDIDAMPVREIEDVFIAGRRFIPYKNRMLDFAQLSELPLIFLEKNTSSRRYMENFLAKCQVEINPEFELATSEMIVQFALRNLGVGCVMRDFAREYIENGMLFELRFNKMIPKRQFYLVRNKKNPLSIAAGKMLEIIEKERP